MYKSPYYNPVINRADYTYDIAGKDIVIDIDVPGYDIPGYDIAGYDSYGAPILNVEAPDYTDYSSASGTGVIIINSKFIMMSPLMSGSGTGSGVGLSAPQASGTGYGAPSAPVLTGDSYYPAPPVEYPEYPEYPTATGTGTGSGPSATSTGEFLPPEIPQ